MTETTNEDNLVNSQASDLVLAHVARRKAMLCEKGLAGFNAAMASINDALEQGGLWCNVPSYQMRLENHEAARQLVSMGYKVWMVLKCASRIAPVVTMVEGWFIAWGNVPEEYMKLSIGDGNTYFVRMPETAEPMKAGVSS